MAQQNRTTLKNYFQTGDKPSQAQYADLIDSNLNLQDTSEQIMQGALRTNDVIGRTDSTSRIDFSTNGEILVLAGDEDMFTLKGSTNSFTIEGGTHITSSGNINTSGNIIANSGSFNYIESINKIRHTDDADTEVAFGLDTVIIKANTRQTFRGGSNFTRLGNDDTPTRISGSSVLFNSPISTTSNIITTLNVTATGNITSNSGTGSFAGGVVLTAPNGNQFRFTVNNSGHLSLTGSAV
jgi:hypothetical protein